MTPFISTGIRRLVGEMIAIVASALFVFSLSFPAYAQPFKASKGEHWTILASTHDLTTAIGIARLYGSSARVLLSDNGWLAVALEPRKGSIADIRRSGFWYAFPKDAFLSDGSRFVEMNWRPPVSPVLAKGSLSAAHPVVLSSEGLKVEVRRIPKKNGWTARLTATENGAPAFSFEHDFDDSIGAGTDTSNVSLVRLEHGRTVPNVVFDAYTGGAHCCTDVAVVTHDASGAWTVSDVGQFDGGGPWFEDVDGDGVSEIVHGDNSFLYLFAPYAGSFQPLVIDEMSNGTFVNVSADPRFRERIDEQLKGLEFQAKVKPALWRSNGFLAAWVADKVRLGQGREAFAKILPLYQRATNFGVMRCSSGRDLKSCPESEKRMLPFPEGLLQHLEDTGYVAPPRPAAVPAPAIEAKTPDVMQSPPPSSSGASAEEKPGNGEAFTGTGFFVTDKDLLTNAHVVEGCNNVDTLLHGVTTHAHVVARDKANDLALVETPVNGGGVATLRSGARLGEDVSAFGFPLSGLLASSGNFTTGTITAVAGLGDDSRYFQISAQVQPGNSGGPLLDRYGNVVGIVVAKINAIKLAAVTDDIAQNINFAIKASIAESFLRANGVKFSADDSTKKLAPEDIAAEAKAVAVRIECQPE